MRSAYCDGKGGDKEEWSHRIKGDIALSQREKNRRVQSRCACER